MCGIVGVISRNENDRRAVRGMADAIAHRGPDAEGFWSNDRVALGHRRLSIVDLDARSNQPFVSRDSRYVIAFNGEIYNFRKIAEELIQQGVALRTTSDTEVIVEGFARWGVGFVQRLTGMFAFAIYDTLSEKLYIFRDRVGKKPLFYTQVGSTFLFGSELKALKCHPLLAGKLAIERKSIATFLQLGYIPQPYTFYEQIYKFPAGHYAVIENDQPFTFIPFWNIAHYLTTSRSTSESAAFQQMKNILTDAVNSRMIADVPVGVFLSGGIDSSLVTAIAAQSSKVKTFSIGFKEQKFNEVQHATAVAQYLNSEHTSYMVDEADGKEMLEKYISHFDEPFADTSAIPTLLVSKLARQEVKVALTGDGGDELFLGYGAHTWANRYGNPIWPLARPVLRELLRLSKSSRWQRVAHMFDPILEEEKRTHIFSQEQYFFTRNEIESNFLDSTLTSDQLVYKEIPFISVLSEAERQALFDFQYYLRDDLLVKVDRASMYYGLECRSPLLDHRLVEFAVNLPYSLKRRGSVTKYLMKKWLYEMVPRGYFDRPKWGFSIPLASWLKSDFKYLIESHLSRESVQQTGLVSVAYVQALIKSFFAGQDYLYNRIWVLILLHKYLKENNATVR